MAVLSAELMTKFRKLVSSSMDDLLDNVVYESSCLEGKDRGSIKGAVIRVRKSKSLVGRWLKNPVVQQVLQLPVLWIITLKETRLFQKM